MKRKCDLESVKILKDELKIIKSVLILKLNIICKKSIKNVLNNKIT